MIHVFQIAQMIVEFVMEIILHVLIVLVFLMVMQCQIDVIHVMQIQVMIVYRIVQENGVEPLQMMSVEFVEEIILHVLIVLVFQTDQLILMNVMIVMQIQLMIACKIVQVIGVVLLQMMSVEFVEEIIHHVLIVLAFQMVIPIMIDVVFVMMTH